MSKRSRTGTDSVAKKTKSSKKKVAAGHYSSVIPRAPRKDRASFRDQRFYVCPSGLDWKMCSDAAGQVRLGIGATGGTGSYATMNMLHVNRIPLFSSSANSSGRKDEVIYNRSIAVKFQLHCKNNVGTRHGHSVCLIWDKERNQQAAANFTLSQIFDSEYSEDPISDSQIGPLSLTKPSTASRFKILRRWDWDPSKSGTSVETTSNVFWMVDEFVDLKLLASTYAKNAVEGAPEEMRDGCLFLAFITNIDQTAVAASAAFYTGAYRYYFHDEYPQKK